MEKPRLEEWPLIQEREAWRRAMNEGTWQESHLLTLYKTHRNTGEWRSTRAVEELMEYILYLEEQLHEKEL